MLSFLPGWLLCPIVLLFGMSYTAVISLLIFIVSCVRYPLLWSPGASSFLIRVNNHLMGWWLYGNHLTLVLFTRAEVHVTGEIGEDESASQIIVSNHISWLDTLIIGEITRKRLPVPKLFLKHSLLYVPFVGIACWGLGMPFMRRYKPAYLLRHPELRNKDIETTRKICRTFKGIPTTFVNFPEGTRFTEEKREKGGAPYKNLLTPKPGSLALAIGSLDTFSRIICVTLHYPDNKESPFKAMLFGRLGRIYINLREIQITDNLKGDYTGDKQFKHSFQIWLRERWQEKDETLQKMKEQAEADRKSGKK